MSVPGLLISQLIAAASASGSELIPALQGGAPVAFNTTQLGIIGRTAAEIAAGVTVTNSAYRPGDPRRYGAVAGTTYETATDVALAASLSIAQQTFIPEGVEFITAGNLTLAAGASLVGPGLLKQTSSTNILLTLANSNTFVNRLQVDCSSNPNASKFAFLISGSGISNIEVSDCRINQGCISTGGSVSYVRILRNNFMGVCTGGVAGASIGIAASGTCTQYQIRGNTVTGSDGAGCAIENFASYGDISHNQFNGNAGEGINMQQAQYFNIIGNTCEGNGLVGIGIYAASGNASSKCNVVGNVCRFNGYDGFDLVPSTTTATPTFLNVTGNYSEANGQAGHGGYGYNIEYTSLSTFTGNSALGNAAGGYNVQGGILNTFTGNLALANGFSSPGTYNGFNLAGCTYCTFVGNTSTNFSSSANQAWGIQENSGANFNTIQGNNCYDNASGAIQTAGAQTVSQLISVNASAQSLSNNSTITNPVGTGFALIRVTTSGNVTGVIMTAGTFLGQTCTVTNESANTITMAASGSNVADGSNCIIAANRQMVFTWDQAASLWYH
jgi:parallel beta-helix repeat protein